VRITLVNPNFTHRPSSDAIEPLAFAILAGLTPARHTVTFYDERVERVDTDAPADLAAFSVQTFTARRAYVLAERFRARGVPVVLGGYHPTFAPGEAARHADAVVMGEAEDTWPAVLADAEAGRLQPVYRSSGSSELRGVVFDRSIYSGKRYLGIKPLQFGRGCPYDCDFCSIHAFHGRSLRSRPPGEVIAEIRALPPGPLFFTDDNFVLRRDTAAAMLQELVPLRRRWVCQASVDVAFDDGLLRLMQRSGCLAVLVGFESFSQANLEQMHKTGNRRRDYAEAVARFRRHGIMVAGSFVFGYDEDDGATVEAALRFGIENKLCLCLFNILFPTPGTRLYERLAGQGRLRYEDWWVHQQYRYGQCYFHPSRLDAASLEATCHEARLRFNSMGSLARRSIDPLANARSLDRLAWYWIVNLVSRREIRRKHGARLGS
jgi:radical SAM superfamily enzyme YgiQ (UPF0313 family)